MKRLSFSILLLAAFALAYGQKKEEINFSDALQVDSSEYFLIPILVDNDNQQLYGKGKGYLPWGNYSDIHFYNSNTNKSKKVFKDQLALIRPFHLGKLPYYREPEPSGNILPHHILYLARIENFNGDNGLDTEDPLYLFLSTKTGDNLRQITPKGFHIVSWTISKDNKIILVKGQNDKNGNKKFGPGDDQLYYRIDLNEDVSKIQCYQINLTP